MTNTAVSPVSFFSFWEHLLSSEQALAAVAAVQLPDTGCSLFKNRKNVLLETRRPLCCRRLRHPNMPNISSSPRPPHTCRMRERATAWWDK